jgi:hypothetical protein
MFISSTDIGVSRGREVDADYLQQVLAENKVDMTWTNEIEMEADND